MKLEHIDYEITKACNLNCIHCSAEAGNGKAPDKEFIKKVLREGSKLGLKRVGITGGEPSLFPQELSDLIDFSYDELKCPVHIHTNGQFKNLRLFSERKEKIENLTLTLLGYENAHDTNCGSENVYQELKSAAKSLLESDISLTIFLIPLSNNYSKLPHAVRDFYALGVRNFRVMRLSPGGRAKICYERLKLNEQESKEFVTKLESMQEELGIKFSAGYCTRLIYPKLQSLKHHDVCMSGINRLHINADGYVFPCTASSGFIEMNIGNLHKQSLEEIWMDSEKLKKFRELSRENCRVQRHYKENY